MSIDGIIVTLFVKNCHECPHFVNVPNDANFCNLAKDTYKYTPLQDEIPSWCPIKISWEEWVANDPHKIEGTK